MQFHHPMTDQRWETMRRLDAFGPVTELQNDYDWKEAFAYAEEPSRCEGADCDVTPVLIGDVARVYHLRVGENDGASWLCIGRTKDGRVFYLTAWCDYTGWDCRASGQCWVSNDMDNLLQFGIDDDARTAFGL